MRKLLPLAALLATFALSADETPAWATGSWADGDWATGIWGAAEPQAEEEDTRGRRNRTQPGRSRRNL